ncbi:LemA family protein [Candidatus Saccharibacteria bacterium]|nr:MAG: LemA family protein [Candidatus Saccharibacteria bacterium]
MEVLIIILVIVAVLGIFLWATYNGLVRLNIRVEEAWSDITVQLKRRADLIPNLVEAVKGYASHEKQVFDDVTKARSAVVNATAQGPEATAKAENMFEGALKSLFAVAEAYPQLRATENFQQLQNELVDTEDKIQASRRFYNGGVRDLNTKIQVFPNNMFAGMLGFKKKEFFEVEDMASVSEPVQVKF